MSLTEYAMLAALTSLPHRIRPEEPHRIKEDDMVPSTEEVSLTWDTGDHLGGRYKNQIPG